MCNIKLLQIYMLIENSGRHTPTCLEYLYLGNRNEKWEEKAEVEENLAVYFIYLLCT